MTAPGQVAKEAAGLFGVLRDFLPQLAVYSLSWWKVEGAPYIYWPHLEEPIPTLVIASFFFFYNIFIFQL